MKKYLIFISLLISCFVGIAQTTPTFPTGLPVQNLGAPGNMVFTRNIQAGNAGIAWYGSFSDTSAANSGSFYSQIAGMTIRTGDTLWIRNDAKTRWDKFGAGATYFDTTASIRPGGSGTISDPKTMDLIVSPNPGNQIVVLPNGVYSTTAAQVQNGLISGGIVIWETGLTYTVTAATYAIGGVIYTSPETSITLDNSDPTNNRIDAFVVTTSSTAIDITGTPSTDPQNPSYDPATQLPLTFVLVTAVSTEPTYCRDSIYFPNNGQNWTMTVSNPGRINTTSTNNPYSVTQDVEFTAAINGDQLRAAKGSAISFSTYSVMVLKIRSKAAWASTSTISIQAYNGITPLGTPIYIGDNTPYAFNSSNAATYQTVVIPLGNLGTTTGATDLLLQVNTISNNTIGFYLDNWELLGCNGAPIPTTGSFWSVNGNSQGTTLFGGTRDNYPVQFVANNLNHTRLLANGSTVMQATTPGLSLQLGTFANADYFLQRSSTSMIQNTGGDYLLKVSGNTMYFVGSANGHIWNSSAGVNQMRLANATGALRLYNYGDNTFTGTATRWLAVDTDGNVIEQAAPLTAVTADNGLSASSSTNVQLGGTNSQLLGNTSISTSAFSLTIPSSNTNRTLQVTNSSTGRGVDASSVGGSGVTGTSTTATGVVGISTDGNGGNFQSTNSIGVLASAPTAFQFTSFDGTGNTALEVGKIIRTTTTTPANGLGGYITFQIETSTNANQTSNEIKSAWTDVTNATRTSSFSITGVNSATTGTILTIAGNGAMTLGAAYQGLGAGYLAVSNTGAVTWSAGGGGGGGDALTANPLSQFAATTSAQLAGVISDETGTGALVFANTPTLVTPILGTPTSVTLTNATGLPIATGISGLGTGVATALAINTGSAGAIVLFNGAGGTPSSLTLTNATGLPITAGTTGTLGFARGGTGLTALGTAGQFLRVNAGATGLEYATVSGSGTMTSATITQPSAGITVTNSGVAQTTVATWTIALANDLAAVEGLATTGIVRRTGTSTWTAGTLVGLTTEVTGTLPVLNGGTGFTGSTANGQLLIGSGSSWARNTLTGTANQINVTNGAGTITLSMAFNPTEQALTSSATINWNWSNGANAVLTLNTTGAILANPTNVVPGYSATLRLIQGAGGSRTITTWTNVRWANGTTPTLSTTAGQTDMITFYAVSATSFIGYFTPNVQ